MNSANLSNKTNSFFCLYSLHSFKCHFFHSFSSLALTLFEEKIYLFPHILDLLPLELKIIVYYKTIIWHWYLFCLKMDHWSLDECTFYYPFLNMILGMKLFVTLLLPKICYLPVLQLRILFWLEHSKTF